MTKVYLAGSWSSAADLREIRERLRARGIEVTSRWLDKGDWPMPGTRAFAQAQLDSARTDCEDIDAADVVLVDLNRPSTQHGRYFEMGYAAAKGKRVALIGPIDCHFGRLFPLHYNTWDEFFEWDMLILEDRGRVKVARP